MRERLVAKNVNVDEPVIAALLAQCASKLSLRVAPDELQLYVATYAGWAGHLEARSIDVQVGGDGVPLTLTAGSVRVPALERVLMGNAQPFASSAFTASADGGALTIRLVAGQRIAGDSLTGLLIALDPGACAVSFEWTTNYNDAHVHATVVVPPNFMFHNRSFVRYGHNTGICFLQLPDSAPWMAIALYARKQFAAPDNNWLVRLNNIRVMYK